MLTRRNIRLTLHSNELLYKYLHPLLHAPSLWKHPKNWLTFIFQRLILRQCQTQQQRNYMTILFSWVHVLNAVPFFQNTGFSVWYCFTPSWIRKVILMSLHYMFYTFCSTWHVALNLICLHLFAITWLRHNVVMWTRALPYGSTVCLLL